MRAGILVLVLLFAVATPLFADDIGVSRVSLREEAGGLVLDVQAPPRIEPLFVPPLLEDGPTFDAEGRVALPGGGSVLRFVLADHDLRSDDTLLLPWARQGLLLRTQVRDGSRQEQLVLREGSGFRIPFASLRYETTNVWKRIRADLALGIRHVLGSWWHLAFVLAVAIAAPGRRGLRWIGWFLAGQLGGLVAQGISGPVLAAPTGELALGLAVPLIAFALATRRAGQAVPIIVFLAGLAHASGHAGPWLPSVASMLAFDALLLLACFAVTSLVRRPGAHAGLRQITVVCLGLLTLGVWLLWVVSPAQAARLTPSLADPLARVAPPLPDGLGGGRRTQAIAANASQAVTPPRLLGAVQAYVVIEPYEIRHEILVRVADLAPWLGDLSDPIPVAAQEALRKRVEALCLQERVTRLDGEPVAWSVDRVDFVGVEVTGIRPREAPQAEALDEARLGLVLRLPTPPIARSFETTWTLFGEGLDAVPITLSDPERTRQSSWTPEANTLTWSNELREDPVPTVEAVQVAPRTIPVPLLALVVLLGLVLLIRRAPTTTPWKLSSVRLALVLALALGPIGVWDAPSPTSSAGVPSEGEAERIAGALLTNVYRSFLFQEEGRIYDRLATSVAGDKLGEIYLEHQRALDVAERGGARARVEAVTIESARDLEDTASGFRGRFAWTVAGSVSHFGHRHYRQNRYVAEITIDAVDGTWKIVAIELLDEQRVL